MLLSASSLLGAAVFILENLEGHERHVVVPGCRGLLAVLLDAQQAVTLEQLSLAHVMQQVGVETRRGARGSLEDVEAF